MDESNPLKQPLDRLIGDGCLNDREIIFFGANKSTKEMCNYIKSKGYEPYAIVDNDSRKQHQKVAGLTTYLPAELLGSYHEKAIILIASEYFNEMAEQLVKLGYDREKQIVQVLRLNRFYDTSKEAFEEYADKVRDGEKIYKNLLAHESSWDKNKDIPSLFICPYPGTGDIYLIGLYLETYCQGHGINIKDSIITVVGKAASRVFDMFSIKNVKVLSQKESDSLVLYVRMMGLEKMRTLICNDGHFQYMTKRFRGRFGIDFHKMFQNAVFGIKKRNDFVKSTGVNISGEKLKEKYPSLSEGHSVLLSPYANTVTDVDVSFWEHIAEKMKKKGYSVFTNSAGETEPVIKGTEKVFVPFSEVIGFVEMAGCFIGVRSGLCDIISSASAKKIILYPEGKLFRACSTYDYFSLNKMALCNDASEIEYGDGQYQLLEDKVMEIIDMSD